MCIDIDDVPDPYSGGPQGFEAVLDLVEDACDGPMQQSRARKQSIGRQYFIRSECTFGRPLLTAIDKSIAVMPMCEDIRSTMEGYMANVTKARTGVLVRQLFRILKSQPDGIRASEALAALAGAIELTEYEAGDYESGGRRFEKIVRFATVDCVKAG